MTTVAITGASGFLGSSLKALLESQGHEVLPVRRGRGPIYPDLPACDVLIHLAGVGAVLESAEQPARALQATVASTLEVLEAARAGRIGRLVLGSSAAVYGPADGALREDHPPAPVSIYGATKRAAELLALAYVASHDVDTVVARIGNPYGPGQGAGVVRDLIRRGLDDGAPLRVRGDGTAIRDFVFVDDVCRALWLLAERGERGGVYNIGGGHRISIRELAERIATQIGLAASDVRPDGANERGKVSVYYPDLQRIAALGFEPTTALDEGLAQTIEWMRRDG